MVWIAKNTGGGPACAGELSSLKPGCTHTHTQHAHTNKGDDYSTHNEKIRIVRHVVVVKSKWHHAGIPFVWYNLSDTHTHIPPTAQKKKKTFPLNWSLLYSRPPMDLIHMTTQTHTHAPILSMVVSIISALEACNRAVCCLADVIIFGIFKKNSVSTFRRCSNYQSWFKEF